LANLGDSNLIGNNTPDFYSDLDLDRNIKLITKSLSRPYFNTALKRLTKINPINTKLVCDYILVEQTEFNIKGI